jgi:hypothetical protein
MNKFSIKTISLLAMLIFLSFFHSCTKKNEESLIKEKLYSLAKDLSFKENVPPLKQILITKSIIEKYFHRNVQIKLHIRQSQFSISNAQILSQHLFLLNKMVGKIDLEFQEIDIQKLNDSGGIFYLASFEIDAIGNDAQENKQIDEKFNFQFYFRKYKDNFLIYRGQTPDQESNT